MHSAQTISPAEIDCKDSQITPVHIAVAVKIAFAGESCFAVRPAKVRCKNRQVVKVYIAIMVKICGTGRGKKKDLGVCSIITFPYNQTLGNLRITIIQSVVGQLNNSRSIIKRKTSQSVPSNPSHTA